MDAPLCVFIEDLDPVVDKGSLPLGGTGTGVISRERFEILDDRWVNINQLRENKIQNIGTRVAIESMTNADIPEMYGDRENHFQDKKDQKEAYTNTLKEICPEFI